MALAFILSQILGGISDGPVSFKYAVVDQDGGTISQAFFDEVLKSLQEQGLLSVIEATSEEEGRQLARDRKVSATFVFPPGFSAAVEAGQSTEIEVIGNVEGPIGTLVANAIAESFTSRVRAVQIAVATVADEETEPAVLAGLATAAAAIPNPVSVEDISATKKQLELKTYSSAGIAVFFLFFTVQFGISSLLDERREGTLSRRT